MFSQRISLVFERLRVVRTVDVERNTLVDLTDSDRVIEGSPRHDLPGRLAARREHLAPSP